MSSLITPSLFDTTSANLNGTMVVELLYPAGFEVTNFGTDNAVGTDDFQVAESRMGVSGDLAQGYTPQPITLNITILPGSPTYFKFCNILRNMQVNKRIYNTTFVVDLPSIGVVKTYSNGGMTLSNIMPAAQATLQDTTWQFQFANVTTIQKRLSSATI